MKWSVGTTDRTEPQDVLSYSTANNLKVKPHQRGECFRGSVTSPFHNG